MELFLKEFKKHLIDASRTDLSELELLDLKLKKIGGYYIYRYLHSNIVRDKWKDNKGYPLKAKFHSKGLLVCSVTIRKISAFTGYSIQTVSNAVKYMECLGHIIKNKEYTFKGQTVYILGKWSIIKNNKNEDVQNEKLYRDVERDKYIKHFIDKPNENDYSNYNFDDIYMDDFL